MNQLRTTNELFFTLITAFFYSTLWVLNPTNKVILFISGLLYLSILLKTKDNKLSLIISFFMLSIIGTGKQYDFIIIPPGIFPIDFYPLGYFVSVIITPAAIVSFFMAIVVFRQWIMGTIKTKFLIMPDILILLGMGLRLLSDLIMSPIKDIAIIMWIFSLPSLVAYLYIRLLCRDYKKLLIYCFSILSMLVLIESSIAITQFMHASPLGKSIEMQKGVGLFGEAADEYAYRFRPVGTFDHTNELGAYLAIYIPLTLYMLALKSTVIKQVTLLAGFITLGITLSRSAWIGLSAGLLWQAASLIKIVKNIFFTLHKISRILILLLACSFFVIILTPRMSSSFFSLSDSGGAYVRSIQASIAKHLILRSPFLGVGTAMTVPKGLEIDDTGSLLYFPSPVHNRYLLLAAENGIPALIIYLLFLVSSVVVLYKITRDGSQSIKGLWHVYVGAVTAIILIGFFQPYGLAMHAAVLFGLIYNHVTQTS